MFQPQALKYLEAVYKYKNFTKAAQALSVSQPAISASIKKMEEAFGITFVIRTPKKVIFTEAGENLLKRIIPLMEEFHAIEQELIEKGQKKKKILYLGISPTAPAKVVQLLRNNFLASLGEDEEVSIEEGGAYHHMNKLAQGELDMAINVIPEDVTQYAISTIPLFKQEIQLIMRSDNSLASYDAIALQKLSNTRLTSLGESSYLPRRLAKEANKQHVALRVVTSHLLQTSYLAEILTENSVGIINVDRLNTLSTLFDHKQLVAKPFTEPMYLDMGIMVRKDLLNQNFTQRAIDFILAISRQLNT